MSIASFLGKHKLVTARCSLVRDEAVQNLLRLVTMADSNQYCSIPPEQKRMRACSGMLQAGKLRCHVTMTVMSHVPAKHCHMGRPIFWAAGSGRKLRHLRCHPARLARVRHSCSLR